MSLPYIYNSDVPQGNQQINNTQKPIFGNFTDIDILFAVNHVGFNIPDNFGKHNFVSYITQSLDPSTAVSEMAIYSKTSPTDPTGLELFYRYPNNGSIVQLTNNGTLIGPSGSGGSYISGVNPDGYQYLAGTWQYLPSGLIIMTGLVQTTGQSNIIQIPIGTNIPVFTSAIFNVQVSHAQPGPASGNCRYGINIINTTSFSIYQSLTTGQPLYWTAIGI